MFFKNLQVYRFTRPLEQDAEALERNLEEFKFKSCGSQDISKLGWGLSDGKIGLHVYPPCRKTDSDLP